MTILSLLSIMAKFDVYASSFVPQWLKDINEAPARIVFSTAPTDFEVRFEEYTRTFAGSSLLGDGQLSLKSESGRFSPFFPLCLLLPA